MAEIQDSVQNKNAENLHQIFITHKEKYKTNTFKHILISILIAVSSEAKLHKKRRRFYLTQFSLETVYQWGKKNKLNNTFSKM